MTGILSILAGVMILLRPVVGTIALVWLFPIWFICHCISRLMNLGVTRVLAGNVYYYFSLVLNIIGIILASRCSSTRSSPPSQWPSWWAST